ncbi:MFS transporter [Aquipuribacter sp. MA13-6]|uniref:MFS transporter n=1 Tax=unclassified Aquipuribacter TaxID=2635084 RepID=UPI003EF045BE
MSEARRVGVLAAAQVAGGVGAAVGIAAGSLLAARVTGGTALAGTAQTATVLGAALLAVPLARLAERLGRRTALSAGLLVAVAGSGLVVLATVTGSFVLLLLGAALFGGGSASGLQARYAATDGTAPGRRGRALSTVVWATTVGAVAGPNLAAPASLLDQALGLPPYSGSYLVAAGAFLLAALVLLLGLPPDPRRGPSPTSPTPRPAPTPPPVDVPLDPTAGGTTVLAVLRTVWRDPQARLGVVALGTAHAVMVGVMVMTPVHLDAHGASFTVVGLVISVHVAGMYGASPLFGWLADRRGTTAGVAVGVVLLLAALAVSGTSGTGLLGPGPASHVGVGLGLLLLGLGWSACLVSGSTLLAGAFDEADPRARTLQGASDLVMGGAGAAAGALSGPVVAVTGYPGLTVAAVLPLTLTLWCLAGARSGPGGRRGAGLLYRRGP